MQCCSKLVLSNTFLKCVPLCAPLWEGFSISLVLLVGKR